MAISKNEFDNIVTAITYTMKEVIAAETNKAVQQAMQDIITGEIRDTVREAMKAGVTVAIR